MQDIILVGSGGCMREIVWQMQEQNKSAENWNILGYVDRMPPEEHSSVTVGNETIEYIGNAEKVLSKIEEKLDCNLKKNYQYIETERVKVKYYK